MPLPAAAAATSESVNSAPKALFAEHLQQQRPAGVSTAHPRPCLPNICSSNQTMAKGLQLSRHSPCLPNICSSTQKACQRAEVTSCMAILA